ncbi:GNAT family N-acetyltransferase [Actinomadura sp. DC4]|uniref:GNAT family N-acetyltransferase n=1 Tax=Actinomadura sp. DC4 TaxID=3055069 RepID=UPI0025B1273C|nr:GNAT family N-acetyltransferase [Actinomadura sp. DC4]MDN3358815.1 GNAT family N-acetyltransferase [Actinomadura sp. DC4]
MRTLSTARLELPPWRDDFEADLLRLASDERVVRFIGDGRPWTRERTAERHRNCLRHWAEHGFGWRAIIDQGGFAGVAALNRLGSVVPGIEEDVVEIGWWVDPRTWGRGVATEAALALRDEAFGGLGAERLAARYQLANPASGRIMAKIGMRVHSDLPVTEGRPVRVYELGRTDWQELRAQV